MRSSPPVTHAERCPYCSWSDPRDEIVLRNDLAVFVRNASRQGALKHSGIVVPVAHKATPFDLDDTEILATFQLLAEVKRWMDNRFAPDGYNLGWNCGATAGQAVFHAHLHVIPRFREEPLAGSGIRSLLKSEANRW